MKSNKKIIAGAALGTFLGSLAVLLYPKRNEIARRVRSQSGDFTEKAKEYADLLLNKGRQFSHLKESRNSNYLKGSLFGLLVGVGAALFLTPKSGKQLRSQVSKAYNDISDRTEQVVHLFKNNSSHPFREIATHHNGVKKKRRLARTKH